MTGNFKKALLAAVLVISPIILIPTLANAVGTPVYTPNLTGTGSITGSNQSVTISTGGYGTVGFQITGTWTGTISVQGSLDGVNWVNTQFSSITNGSTSGSTTSNTIGQINSAGLAYVRLYSTPFTAGTATVNLQAANQSLSNATITGGGGASAYATSATPTYTNNSTVNLSTDLSGNLRTLDSGTPNWLGANSVGASNVATAQVSVGTSATQIVAARTGSLGTGRQYLTLIINSASNVCLGSSTVTTTTGACINGPYTATFNSTAALYGVVATGTVTVNVMETY